MPFSRPMSRRFLPRSASSWRCRGSGCADVVGLCVSEPPECLPPLGAEPFGLIADVLSRTLLRIYRGRWSDVGVAARVAADGPALAVVASVVVPAEQESVVDVAGSAGVPRHSVMRVAVDRCGVTARVDAALVAQRDGAALGGSEQASRAAEVEDLAASAEHGGQDLGVAREGTEGGRVEGAAVGKQPGCDGARLECVERRGDDEGRGRPARVRQVAGAGRALDEGDQGIGPTLGEGARVGSSGVDQAGSLARVRRLTVQAPARPSGLALRAETAVRKLCPPAGSKRNRPEMLPSRCRRQVSERLR